MGKRDPHNNNAERVARHRETTGTYPPQADQDNFMFLAKGNGSVNLTALFLLGLVASGALIDGVSAATTTPPNRGARAKSNTPRITAHNATQVQTSSTPINGLPPQVTAKPQAASVIVPDSTQASKKINKRKTSNVFNTANINGVNGHIWALEKPAQGFKSDTTGVAVSLIADGNGNLNLIGSSPDSTTKHPNGQVNMAYAIDTTSGSTQETLSGTAFTSSSSKRIGIQISQGDFNGDGIQDFVIQAGGSKVDDPRTVFMVFGNKNGLPENVDLDTMPQGTGVKITQTHTDGSPVLLGKNAASIGDPDGSGYDKIAIPNCVDPTEEDGPSDSVCILNGRPTTEWPANYDLDQLANDDEGTVIRSLIHNGLAVYHPFSLPNVTGNGMDGFAIASPYDTFDIHKFYEGVFNIFYPNPNGFPKVVADPDRFLKNGGGTVLTGGEPHAYVGMASTTDFTTVDGTPAIAVGAPQAKGFGPGKVYVVKTPIQNTITESPFNLKELTPEQGLVMPGQCDGDLTGRQLAPGLTFVDDTTNTLVVGTGKGKVYIAKVGEPNSENEIPLSPENPEVMTVIGKPGAFGDELGRSMDSAIDPKTNTTVIALGAPGAADGGNIVTLNGGQEFPLSAEDLSCSTPTPSPTTNTPSPAGNHDDGSNVGKWIGATIGAGAVIAAIGFFAYKRGACRNPEEMSESSQLLPSPINSH